MDPSETSIVFFSILNNSWHIRNIPEITKQQVILKILQNSPQKTLNYISLELKEFIEKISFENVLTSPILNLLLPVPLSNPQQQTHEILGSR